MTRTPEPAVNTMEMPSAPSAAVAAPSDRPLEAWPRLMRMVRRACAITVALAAAQARAQPCEAKTVRDAKADQWANKIVAALVGDDACYADVSAFTNSDCNIFVGRVLEQGYGIKDFVLPAPKNGLRYKVSNEIAALLWTSPPDAWEPLGGLKDQAALDMAQQRAYEGKAVVAVWLNDLPSKKGHIALVGPGPLTPSGKLGVNTPVSASFFQGEPAKNYIGKPLSCAFRPTQAANVRLFARK